MRIPAGLTSTGMTTITAASPMAEAEKIAERTRRERKQERERTEEHPGTVLMRPTGSTAALDVFLLVGVLAGFAAVAAAVLLAHPAPPTLLKGFGPESTWAMPATAIASALGLTFLITAVLSDRRAEDDFRRACQDRDSDISEGSDRARRMP